MNFGHFHILPIIFFHLSSHQSPSSQQTPFYLDAASLHTFVCSECVCVECACMKETDKEQEKPTKFRVVCMNMK